MIILQTLGYVLTSVVVGMALEDNFHFWRAFTNKLESWLVKS